VFSYPCATTLFAVTRLNTLASVINKFGRTELIPWRKQYVGIEAAANAPV
jgi:hypothetical protein